MKQKMIPPRALVAFVLGVGVMLMTSVAPAGTESRLLLSPPGKPNLSGTNSQPEVTKITGSRYRLTDTRLFIIPDESLPGNLISSGGGYRLEQLVQPKLKLTGSGCCCIYLPNVIR